MYSLTINNTLAARRATIDGVKTAARSLFAALSAEQRTSCVLRIFKGTGVSHQELVELVENNNSWRLRWKKARAHHREAIAPPPIPGHPSRHGIDVNASFNRVFGGQA